MQIDQAYIMHKKRTANVKKCEFRKHKEWAKDFIQGNDFEQM